MSQHSAGTGVRALADSLDWARAGTALIDEMISGSGGFAIVDWAADSGLPGWTRKHLGAHLAANADALGNLVHWAATGDPTPMYRSAAQRAQDIEAGSRRPAEEIAAWLRTSSAALFEAIDLLTPEHWQAPVVTAQGRTVAATEIPWMRAREVCIHAVDMATGLTFADLPDGFVLALIDDVADKRSSQNIDVGVVLAAADRTWTIGDAQGATVVSASPAELAAYLTGRSDLTGAPELGAWL